MKNVFRTSVVFAASVVMGLSSCNDNQQKEPSLEELRVIENQSFDSLKTRFLNAYWKQYPTSALYNGLHEYDSVLPIPDQNHRQQYLAFSTIYLDSLSKVNRDLLSAANLTDLLILENELNSTMFSIREFRQYQWDPSNYNLTGIVFEVLKYQQHPLDVRVRHIGGILSKVSDYYHAARQNIENPTLEHTTLAISQIRGGLDVFNKDLADSIRASTLSESDKQQLLADKDSAVAEIGRFADWLDADILPKLSDSTARSFRIGKELFNKKFAFDIQSGYSADEIYQVALGYKADLHVKMYELSAQLWPKYMKQPMPADSLQVIGMMINHLSGGHVARTQFIPAIREQLSDLEKFIKEKDLMYMDPSKPLVVRETPMYMRGVAGASISAPGPFDAGAETFYNVTPLDDYSADQAESYLREYNDYILQILNIHEAIPGHYTQLVYSNKSPSIVKSIFGNGAMVEGWAVYTERMMLEEGYKNSPEMWLMYYKWNLRTVCNTILDYSVHVLGMTESEAMDLLVRQAFQQDAEAKGKWRRATLSQVQLCSYFTGFYEIYSLRDELKKQKGDQFQLKAFHEEFLSYGSAPVKHIATLMLGKEQGSVAR